MSTARETNFLKINIHTLRQQLQVGGLVLLLSLTVSSKIQFILRKGTQVFTCLLLTLYNLFVFKSYKRDGNLNVLEFFISNFTTEQN